MPKPIRQTQKTRSSNPENPFDCTISNPHRADRTTSEIVAPQHRSTQNRSFSLHPKTDCSRAFVLDLDSLSPTQLRRPHSSNPVASLSLSLNLTRFDEFFFVRICFFCVYLLGNDINICLEAEKM